MKKTLLGALAVVAVVFAVVGGYYAGTHPASGLSRLTREAGKGDAPPPKRAPRDGSSHAPAPAQATRLARLDGAAVVTRARGG